MRFLVTAGNTREMIDQVRDWGNIFTGATGLAIARALTDLGPVDLLTSNPQHLAELRTADRITTTQFRSHAELKGALAALLSTQNYDAIFMTAAVADYRPEGVYAVERRDTDPNEPNLERWTVRDVQAAKIKSTHSAIAVLGQPTEKLVDLFRKQWNFKGLLFKFKLEVAIPPDQLIQIAQASRKASGADYLIANTLDMIQGDRAGAFLLGDSGREWVPRGKLPGRVVEIVRERYNTPLASGRGDLTNTTIKSQGANS